MPTKQLLSSLVPLLLLVSACQADEKPATPTLDFETGTLRGWTATGTAFRKQPIAGDAVRKRRGDMKSGQAGKYWIGSYEVGKDAPRGTLTSAPFTVTQPFASFLVGGGNHDSTRVEVVRADTKKVVFKASGRNHEQMERVAVDLRKHLGKPIFIRVVDLHSGGWGHINFDDFQFHTGEPKIAARRLGEGRPAKRDAYQFAGLSPEKAAKAMTLPKGFSAQVFAAEPDVKQPIAMAIDDRGRIWVAEAYEYPFRATKGKGRDRILIFEDTNLDGRFDKRTVFAENLNLVSGLEVGFGGVWVGAAPYLLFIPDKNGDDKPDGPPQILLDGWGYQDTHETLNAFIWGPDGWLYGCHGVFTHSNVGKPGTPDNKRQQINAGIWRYHPRKHVFEVFAHGTSNPWGVDFNDRGQAFLTACVIPHLFHVIQGGRYRRQAGTHFNPYTYDDIKTIAKHRHWLGGRPHSGNGRSDAAGGGHAHAGAMIYLGGSWPEKYRDQIFMNNIHGARLNQDQLARQGSGYLGDRAPDFLLANDTWSQMLNFRYGPDGQVYLIDWYDMQQCHNRTASRHDRSNGRIFRIAYNNAKPVKVDLKKLSNKELVALQLHKNDWYVRHARRILQERGPDAAVHQALAKIALNHADETRRLRGLWALHVTGGLTDDIVNQALIDGSEYVRGWTIQLATANGAVPLKLRDSLAEMAAIDKSQVVRLYLASLAGRLPVDQRWPILYGLLSHSEDATDHNLPLMYWYAFEPAVAKDLPRALALASASKVPLVRDYVLRRIGAEGTGSAIAMLITALGKTQKAAEQRAYLGAINESLKGRRKFDMPKGWPAVAKNLAGSSDSVVRTRSRMLGVTFGDPRAFAETRAMLVNDKEEPAQRKTALESLLAAGDKQLAPTLQTLIEKNQLRAEAIRGLAAYADPRSAELLLKVYPNLDAAEKRDALSTLSSRISYATSMLAAVEAGKIPAKDLSAELVRQLGSFENKSINATIGKVWGVVRTTPAEKKLLIARYKAQIEKPGKRPDVELGRAVFVKTCAQCHKLYDAGGAIGPELTGSNRRNLDYLLSNVLDPSAVMAKAYQPSVIATEAGRVITGIIKQEDKTKLTVVTANETIIVPRNEIEAMKRSATSMMPDNIWQKLDAHEVRSLVAYLAGSQQVPIQATAENVKSFFNGRDLTGWKGNPKLWKVENGELVGTSPGLRRNEFLVSDFSAGDFDFTVDVKLTPNAGNSGIQFRSETLPRGLVKGYQADVGVGWWGKLYEEHGRALLWKQSGEKFVKKEQWNTYRIVASGSRIRTWINGNLCVDLNDPAGRKRGVFAIQLHSGGPMTVRYRNFKLKLSSPAASTAATSSTRK